MSQQISGGVIQAGVAVKVATGAMTIQFERPFASPPVVVLGSMYESPGYVGNVDGIQSISTTGFVVNSGNAADNYYINWIAYGTM